VGDDDFFAIIWHSVFHDLQYILRIKRVELGIQNVKAGNFNRVPVVIDEVLHVRLVVADFGHVLLLFLGWLGLILLHKGKLLIFSIVLQ
jgi:hypothetical protein